MASEPTRSTRLRRRLAVAVRHELAAPVAVVAVGAALRLFQLTDESVWLDEGIAYHTATRRSVPEIVFGLAGGPNPPLYFLFLHGWVDLAGTSLFALRLPSAVAGVASVALTYLLGRRLYDRRVGLLAAAVLALAQFHLEYAQMARMYAILVALTLGSFLWFVRYWEDGTRRAGAAYLLVTVAMVYTHTFALFTVMAQAAFVAAAALREGTVRSTLRRWAPVGVAGTLLTGPWVVHLAARVLRPVMRSGGGPDGGGGVGSGIHVTLPPPHSLASAYVDYLMPLEPFVSGMRPWALPALAGTVVALGGAAAAGVRPLVAGRLLDRSDGPAPTTDGGTAVAGHATVPRSLRGRPRTRALLLGSWAVVPVPVPFVLSYLVTPIFLHRYTIAASVGVFLLAAAGLARVRRRHLRYALITVLLVGLAAPLPWHYGVDQKEQWREAAATVEHGADPGDLVVVSERTARYSFDFHFDDEGVRVVAVEEGAPASRLAGATAGHDAVWHVTSHLSEARERRQTAVLSDLFERTRTERFNNIVVRRYERTPSDAGADPDPGLDRRLRR
ncbi:glycosyltransferase family 39 protein [Halobaculum sp. EA56]|uniref:glycosyltransferase family 39 protein n=1 Tax=Halobaculum sp. EA56 TaxID=3421648 RepID=UPI003EBB8F79